ncbi:sigma 54-interacting transcriptional regulator [Bradyrhizobium sp. LA2.1]|uniref:sigma-54-dependent transcriptional regulator n=1 Tax=Bradyrhizobium TaxID=374 RepID=UPI003396AF76
MTLSIWFKSFSGEAAVATAVTKRLAHFGLTVRSDESFFHDGDCCLAAVSAVDATVIADLEKLSRSFHVVVLSVPKSLPRESRWQLLHAGVADVLDWTDDRIFAEQIVARVHRHLEIERLANDDSIRNLLVGDSPAWRELVRRLVEIASFSGGTLLVVGETGTGKEQIARALHLLDRRDHKPDLVIVDCTTLSPELSGSELFGHERGAFTGAVAARDGAFALADGGTLLLDEIGELPMPLQAQLLRVIQEHTYKRVGGNVWHNTEFRLICATNRDLEQCVRNATFRADLYYRLADWILRPPPLRERREDIPLLVRHFLEHAANGGSKVEVDPSLADFLLCRDYPGNVRDLKRIVMRLHARHVGPGPITIGALPADDRPDGATLIEPWAEPGLLLALQRALDQGIALKEIGRAVTNVAIRMSLAQENGNLQRAAKRLGVTDRALQMRRASHGGLTSDLATRYDNVVQRSGGG